MLGHAGSGKLRVSAAQNKLVAKVAEKFKEKHQGTSGFTSGLTTSFAFTPVQEHMIGSTIALKPLPDQVPAHIHMPDVANMHDVENMPTPQTANKSSAALPHTMVNNAREPTLGEGHSTSAYIETTFTARSCELLDCNKNCVALEKEVIDPYHKDSCHGYHLNEHEVKVSMCVRKIYTAKLYKETPNAKTINDIGLGEFFVWPKSHVMFHE